MESKIFKYLIVILSLIAVLIVIKVVFFAAEKPQLTEVLEQKSIKINFTALENPLLQKLIPLEKIYLPEKIGRQNPFAPY